MIGAVVFLVLGSSVLVKIEIGPGVYDSEASGSKLPLTSFLVGQLCCSRRRQRWCFQFIQGMEAGDIPF